MALHITFKPGEKQSQQAARYFNAVVGTLVESVVQGLEEREYRISGGKKAVLRLRVWSEAPLEEEELHALLDHILTVRRDLAELQQGPHAPERLAPFAQNWLSPHLGGMDLLVELAIAPPEGAAEPVPEFSMGLLRGRSVLISTDNVLFTWVDRDLFGLTLAGHGSYLLAVDDARGLPLQKAS